MGVKYDPRAAGFDGMDSAQAVETADVDNLDKANRPTLKTPEGRYKVSQEIADYFMGDNSFKTIVEARKKISEITGEEIQAASEQAKQADETIETAVVLAARHAPDSIAQVETKGP